MKIFIVLFVLLSTYVHAAVQVDLYLDKNEVKQGSIETARIVMNVDGAQRVPWQKLKGETLGESLYLYDVSPIVRKQGEFEAEAKIIFSAVPQANILKHKVADQEILIDLKDTKVIPVDSKQFVYDQFDIPFRTKIVNVLPWVALILLIGVGTLYGVRRFQQQSKSKRRRKALRDEIISAQNYDEVIALWYRRDVFQKEFPEIQDSFKEFERGIYQVIFRPTLSDAEKKDVFNSYQSFVGKVSEVLNGI